MFTLCACVSMWGSTNKLVNKLRDSLLETSSFGKSLCTILACFQLKEISLQLRQDYIEREQRPSESFAEEFTSLFLDEAVEGTGGSGRHQTRNPQGLSQILPAMQRDCRRFGWGFLKSLLWRSEMVGHRLRDAYWMIREEQIEQIGLIQHKLKDFGLTTPGQCSGGCGASTLGGVGPPGDQQRGGLRLRQHIPAAWK